MLGFALLTIICSFMVEYKNMIVKKTIVSKPPNTVGTFVSPLRFSCGISFVKKSTVWKTRCNTEVLFLWF